MILPATFNDTHRWQTFTFPIFVDDVPEGVEELTLTLSLPASSMVPEQSFNITPAVATVRIRDFSCKLNSFAQALCIQVCGQNLHMIILDLKKNSVLS